ncbi:MAG: MATE family efflux transporter [Oscillospiraceae bacterium]
MFAKFKRLFGAQDMTVGNPMSVLLKFAIPLLIGNLAQQLYNTVDAIVVGQYIGDGALAAVGAANPILNLLLALFMGVSTGAGIIVSQYFGAKQREMLSKTVGNVITLTFIVTGVVMVIGFAVSFPILSFLSTPTDIIGDANAYLLIIFAGFLGCSFYNMISGILRGLGDSMMPLVYLLTACGTNILLDILFVAVFKLGVPGVALATIIAQFISAVLCVKRLFHMRDVLDIGKKYLRPDKVLIGKIIRIGMPSGFTQAIFSCAAIVVQSLTNSFGTAVIATSTVIMRVDGFAMLPNFTYGMAMTTYVGQNIGGQKMDRVHNSAKVGLKISLITSLVLVTSLIIFGEALMRIFTTTPEVIDLGMRMIRMMAIGYVGVAITQVLMGIMRGAGDTVTPMIISLITTVVLRVPVAYLLAFVTRSAAQPTGAPESIFYSLMISWTLGAIITAIFYRRGKWKSKAGKLGIGLAE